jgi:hypothetical protein
MVIVPLVSRGLPPLGLVGIEFVETFGVGGVITCDRTDEVHRLGESGERRGYL